VTLTEAVTLAVVARSVLSAREAVVWSDPDAEDEMSTVAMTVARGVPAVIGASVEVQVSTLLAPFSAQLHPVGVGAAANVSPDGREAVRVGSVYAVPPDDPTAGLRVRLYCEPAAAPEGVPEAVRLRTGGAVTPTVAVALVVVA
jgi:hypothetical protein